MEIKELITNAKWMLQQFRDPALVLEIDRQHLVVLLDYIEFLEEELAFAKIEALAQAS